jgi:hypothetical protein
VTSDGRSDHSAARNDGPKLEVKVFPKRFPIPDSLGILVSKNVQETIIKTSKN